jgi:hypothetical protein
LEIATEEEVTNKVEEAEEAEEAEEVEEVERNPVVVSGGAGVQRRPCSAAGHCPAAPPDRPFATRLVVAALSMSCVCSFNINMKHKVIECKQSYVA